MILVLYGKDSYRRSQKVRDILAEFARKHPSAGYAPFDFAEDSGKELARFQEFGHTLSMFEPKKLALLSGVFASESKELAKELKILAERPDFTILVSDDKSPAAPFTFLKKSGDTIRVHEFDNLEGTEWLAFVRIEASARGISLAPDALRLLADADEKDGWRLATDLDKLAGLGKKTISAADLDALDLENVAPDFRETMAGLTAPLPSRRLAALEAMFSANEPAAKLFHMIAYWWPAKLEAIAEYDRAVKSGKLDYEEALTDLAVG